MEKFYFVLILAVIGLSGCMKAAKHHELLPSTQDRQMTVGIVQKEIRHGMTQTAVAEALGSPNIISSDHPGQETWIYDKINTDIAYSTSSGGAKALVIGWGPKAVGGPLLGYGENSGAATRTQRTLTVIIKFKERKVYDFSYHSSRF